LVDIPSLQVGRGRKERHDRKYHVNLPDTSMHGNSWDLKSEKKFSLVLPSALNSIIQAQEGEK
jgi:hypothetical protein